LIGGTPPRHLSSIIFNQIFGVKNDYGHDRDGHQHLGNRTPRGSQ